MIIIILLLIIIKNYSMMVTVVWSPPLVPPLHSNVGELLHLLSLLMPLFVYSSFFVLILVFSLYLNAVFIYHILIPVLCLRFDTGVLLLF